MPHFIVNNPKDLLVLREDGVISRVPVGEGYRQKYSKFEGPVPKKGQRTEVGYRSEDPGLDLEYFSVEELAPANDEALRQKIKEAYKKTFSVEILTENLVQHFEGLAILSVKAIFIDEMCKTTGLNETTEAIISHYIHNGRDQMCLESKDPDKKFRGCTR